MLGDQVFRWFTKQPAWQQDLARRVAHHVELPQADYEAALGAVSAAFGIPTERPATTDPIAREDIEERGSAPLARLLALGSLDGVGLVATGEELRFARDGLTVVYGHNASGKSSYVRALKRLCRTADAGCRIRSNVFDSTQKTPTAKVEFDLAGSTMARRTRLDEEPDVRLRGMSVFDSACAELYVNAQNHVEYVPVELRVLARLASLQDRLRKDLEQRKQTLLATKPSSDAYGTGTAVANALAGLAGDDNDPDLASLATFTAAEQERRHELRALVAAAKASTARVDALAAERDSREGAELAAALRVAAALVSPPSVAQVREAARDAAAAREAVELAARELGAEGAGVGSDPWRVMFEAARNFCYTASTAFPPAPGDVCPLCRQMIDAPAAERLRHFDAHVASSVQETAARATARLEQVLGELDAAHAARCRTSLLLSLRDREPELAAQVDGLIDAIAAQLDAVRATPHEATPLVADVDAPVAALTRWLEQRAGRAADLLAIEDSATLATAEAELAELDDRARLQDEVATFDEWRENLRIVNAIDQARAALVTTRVTAAQRQFAEKAVSLALKEAVKDERKKLQCDRLPVEVVTRSAHAETKASLTLLATQPARIAEIVSEGERRALALCFFFAELTVADDDGGIVVDDPVSSLDEERRQYIAERLVAEAAHRQVIVFTHDLPFVLDLQTQAEENGVAVMVQSLWRHGDHVGRVDTEPPFRAMNLKDRIGKLQTRVQEWDTHRPSTQDEEWRRVTAFYSDLRIAWERAVEERLFQRTVMRLQRPVRTQSLKHVVVTDEFVKMIEDGMTRASMFVHDEPAGAGIPLPGRTDLAADLECLTTFAKLVKLKG